MSTPSTFALELEATINRYSQENGSNTPDFILAQYLLGCLSAWNEGVQAREKWYGREPKPSSGIIESTENGGHHAH